MSLIDNKAGSGAVDPFDHNALVDAVVALQAGGGGGSQTLAQVLSTGNDADGNDADGNDLLGVWGLTARSIDPNPAAPGGAMPINTGGGAITTGGGSLDLGAGGMSNVGETDMGGASIASLADPTSPQDAATKNYVDTTAGPFVTTQGIYSGTLTAVPDGTSDDFPLTLGTGAALLDLTTPDAPFIVTAGTYAISFRAACVGLTADGWASIQLAAGVFLATGEMSHLYASGALIAQLGASNQVIFSIANEDGAAARDFSLDVEVVRLA